MNKCKVFQCAHIRSGICQLDEVCKAHQPMVAVDMEKVRRTVADYMNSEGCSCCEGRDHKKHRNILGAMLGVDMYDDGSGYDFNKYATNPI